MTDSFASLGVLLPDLLEIVPDKPVTTPAGAGEVWVAEAFAALAYPAYLTGRNPGHQSVVLYISGHHRASAYQGAATDGMAAHYRAVRAERCAFAHARTRVDPVHREVRPRGDDVREHAGRTAENVVLQLDAIIDGHVVLDPDAVTYPYAWTYVYILAERAILADDGAGLDVAEVPYLGSGPDHSAIIDITAFVNEVVHFATHV